MTVQDLIDMLQNIENKEAEVIIEVDDYTKEAVIANELTEAKFKYENGEPVILDYELEGIPSDKDCGDCVILWT